MKVLVVEDIELHRFILGEHLRRHGHTVVSAKDGLEAWKILQADPEIYCVLTDWMMPGMDGLELCRAVRSDKRLGHYVYIVVLTANDDHEAMIQSMDAGADDFLFKPFKPAELQARLRAAERVVNLEIAQQQHLRELQTAYEQICQDLQVAGQMQRALLPPPGRRRDVEFSWLFYPGRFLAGDIFDFFELGEEHVGFYLLDVAGHGVGAALMSFSLYHQLSGQAGQKNFLLDDHGQPLPPAQVAEKLNARFQSPDLTQYFTMIYGHLHPASGVLSMVQAGHPCPLLLRRDGRIEKRGEGSFPLGMFPQVVYQNIVCELARGERLFIYSDGLDACRDPTGDPSSETCLDRLLVELRAHPLPDALARLEKKILGWRGNDSFDDDTSMLAISLT